MESATAALAPCSRCGRSLDAATALYSDAGEVICPACNMASEAESSADRGVKTLRGSAYGAPFLGLLSIFVNPFFLISLFAILGAAGVLVTVARNSEYKKRLGGHLVPVYVACVAAIVFASVTPLTLMLGVLGLLVG